MPSFRSSFSSNSRREMHLGFTIGLHNVDRTACLLAAGGNLDKCNTQHSPLAASGLKFSALCVSSRHYTWWTAQHVEHHATQHSTMRCL